MFEIYQYGNQHMIHYKNAWFTCQKILIKLRGETFALPVPLEKLIETEIFKKICEEELYPIIKYLGKKKHQKIKDREYHYFKFVKVLNKDGKDVTDNSEASRQMDKSSSFEIKKNV